MAAPADGKGKKAPAKIKALPLLGFAKAGRAGFFDEDGMPTGSGWEQSAFPAGALPEGSYALRVSGDSMQPLYRDGDQIVVAPARPVRRGDRVVVRTLSGEVMAKELLRRNAERLELKSLNADHADITLKTVDIDWMARIEWVSQ